MFSASGGDKQYRPKAGNHLRRKLRTIFLNCTFQKVCVDVHLFWMFLIHTCTSINFHNIESVIPRLKSKKNYEKPKGSSLWAPGSGFSIRIRVGGKLSKVGSEGRARAEGMTLGWGCMGASPTWMILKIWTS